MSDSTRSVQLVINPFYRYFVSGVWGGIFITVAGIVAMFGLSLPAAGTLGLELGMCYWLGMSGFGLIRMQYVCLPPSPLPDDGRGRVRLEDPGDGIHGFLDELAGSSAFVAAGTVALVMAWVFFQSGLVQPHGEYQLTVAAVTCVFGLACLGISWLLLRNPYRAMRMAGPGRFAFTAWPIAPGVPVQVHFSRRLHPSCDLVRCEATLEYVTLTRWHNHHRHVQVQQAIPLGDGGVRRKRGGIGADLAILVPAGASARADSLLGAEAHGSWRLRITFEITGLPDERSELYLALMT